MKKKMKKTAGALLLMFFMTVVVILYLPVTAVRAEDTATADFQINEGVLVKYQGTASTVTVPAEVEEIGEAAFAGNTTLVSVKIPSTVKKISYEAFSECTSLERMFIPSGVEELGNGVFAGCINLKNVSFGKDLKTVGNGVFAGCRKLEKVNIASKNPYLSYSSGVLYDKNKTVVIEMMPGRKKSSYSFPSTVTDIRPYAFWGAQNLEKVLLSQKLHEIPAYAFSNCNALTGVEIPYSVYRIETKAFENCVSLEEAIIHPSVSYIDDTAFDGCTKMKITAEEGSIAYEFALNHPISEETEELEAENTDNVNGTEQSAVPENLSGENNSSAETQNNNNASGSGYVDPLEATEDGTVRGKTRVVGNDAFVIVDGTGLTVH